MSKIGRNEPCPCGSGKKYERCCLRGDAERQKRDELEHTAPGRALTWLHEHHGEAMRQAFRDEFFGSLDDDGLARLERQAEEFWQMIDINGWELVLAEGKLGHDQVGCLDLIFGPGGPLLDAVQRQWLEKLQKASLSLYEVVESNPGAGFKLRDLTDRDKPALWIQERAGSRSAGPGTVLGARIIPGSPNKLSGAIYGFPESQARQVLEELRAELDQAPDPDDERQIRSMVIVDGWLRMLTMPPPTFVDASSGEVSLLINDYYRVADWDQLAAALEAQHDVVGDRGDGWTRLRDPEAEMSSTLLAINLKGDDRIEAFARSRTMADDGREWLEEVAGDAIAWITREIIDPMSVMDELSAKPRTTSSRPLDPSELPEGFHQQLYEQIYGDWADEPIPALGDRTPRQALETPEGKRQVVELLESYERGERKQAAAQQRDEADLGFLWRELGLERGGAGEQDAT